MTFLGKALPGTRRRPRARPLRARRRRVRRSVRIRHAFEEAGFHISATWAELTDWIRIGR